MPTTEVVESCFLTLSNLRAKFFGHEIAQADLIPLGKYPG